jgi:hypothetical protein
MNNGKPFTMLDLCKIDPEKAAERIEALIKRNADLEKELNLTKDIIVAHQIADETGYIDGVGWVENWSEMEKTVTNLLEAHNLEQQALALSDARHDFTYSSDAICVNVDDLDKRIKKLQCQAKALKEPKI